MKMALCSVALAAAFGVVSPLSAVEPSAATNDVVTLRITERTDPAYPRRMFNQAVRHGEARIVICVDKEEKLSDSLVLAYTDKAFADSALVALKTWRFAPPQLGGKNIGAITE